MLSWRSGCMVEAAVCLGVRVGCVTGDRGCFIFFFFLLLLLFLLLLFFFFNDTATTEIYTLSLHDALPISG